VQYGVALECSQKQSATVNNSQDLENKQMHKTGTTCKPT